MAEETRNKNTNKLSLAFTLILSAVLIAAVVMNFTEWADHRDKLTEIDILAGEISQINQEIAGIPEPSAGVETNIEVARDELKTAQGTLPSSINRNAVIDHMLKLAVKCRVNIIPLVSEGWLAGNGDIPYRVLKINSSVSGNLSNVITFISGLQDSEYSSLAVTGLSVKRHGESSSGNSSAQKDVPVAVRLGISISDYSPLNDKDIE
jgi:hypothetical protein